MEVQSSQKICGRKTEGDWIFVVHKEVLNRMMWMGSSQASWQLLHELSAPLGNRRVFIMITYDHKTCSMITMRIIHGVPCQTARRTLAAPIRFDSMAMEVGESPI